jgi:hypothetical protein
LISTSRGGDGTVAVTIADARLALARLRAAFEVLQRQADREAGVELGDEGLVGVLREIHDRIDFLLDPPVAQPLLLVADQLLAELTQRRALHVRDGQVDAELRPRPGAHVVGGVGLSMLLTSWPLVAKVRT